LCGQKDKVEIKEINIQPDHIHMIISIPPKYSISQIVGYLKGKTAMRLYDKRKELTKRYWGRHIWSRGYCVSSVGLSEEEIKKYVKWQQEKGQQG
jgi:putative transposase